MPRRENPSLAARMIEAELAEDKARANDDPRKMSIDQRVNLLTLLGGIEKKRRQSMVLRAEVAKRRLIIRKGKKSVEVKPASKPAEPAGEKLSKFLDATGPGAGAETGKASIEVTESV